jgi:CO/xanthine dehydrogenase FAD-binding subunit
VTRFQYVRPGTRDAALAILTESGPAARLLAGGTDVMVRLRSGHMRPGVIVDLKRIDDLDRGIARAGQVLRIGARCTMTELLADARVRGSFPALAEAAAVVGSVQIRNRATLAGNLCNASPAADTAPALLAYGAVVNTVGIGGERHLPLSEFFKGPGRTALGGAELVTSIDLPIPSAPLGAAFLRLTRRRGVDLAILSVCCTVSRGGEVRVGLGAVAPTPLLVTEVDPGLVASAFRGNSSVSGILPAEAGSHASELEQQMIARIAAPARPISDVRAGGDYRAAMLPVFIRRALARAMQRLDGHAMGERPGARD